MNLDSTTADLIYQREHELRVKRAQHDRLARQAAASHSRQSVTTIALRKAGIVLVAMGVRLQGSPNRTGNVDVADPAGTFHPSG
jgi:hypothetical protein